MLAISTQALPPPLTIPELNVTGATNANGSNVTVVAKINLTDMSYGGAQVMLSIKSTDNMVGQLFQPEPIEFVADTGLSKVGYPGTCTWTNDDFNPYFTGDYVVTVVANLTNVPGLKVPFGMAMAATTVTVARTFGGTLNSVQEAVDTNLVYDANGAWTNIDLSRVYLHSIGVMADPAGAISIGCNLINVTNIMGYMTEEQMDMAFTDTSCYRPYGTPFRFDINMHARPQSLMGFGEVKRFVWTPVAAEAPRGPGRLVVDVTCCRPWRNNYSTNLQAHVGFAPLFMTDTNEAEELEGMLLCTSAHFMDVAPDISEIGIGLKVNGKSNTTSYLKAFIPDSMLERLDVPVERAPELLAGFVTHFTSNDVSEGDTATVETEFTRIAGGTNIVYAYNSSTNGDAGYEARLTFTFHSPVAAQIGLMPNAALTGDIDGDHLADLMTVVGSKWYVWFSSSGYGQCIGPIDLGVPGMPATGDLDGDRLSDLIEMVGSNCFVWFSRSGYAQPIGPIDLGVSGTPVTGDIDGDGLADLIVVDDANWYVWFSQSGYAQHIGPVNLGIAGTPATGDIDGDGLADLIVVDDANWYVWFSLSGYAQYIGPVNLGISGTPATGDIDGDRLADLMDVVDSNWFVWLSRPGYAQRIGPCPLPIL